MGTKESGADGIIGGRTAIAILIVAIVWRAVISLDGKIAFWESLCSGIALIVLGWVLFAYMYRMSKELKGWIISNYIYQGIAVCLLIINIYALIYYGMRWFKLLSVEAYLPYDFIFRDVRYIALVVFYCAVMWSAGYPKRMHEEYISKSKDKTVLHIISPFLYTRVKKLKQMGLKELIATVITDERTLLVIVGLAFLWRIVISLDYNITLGESVGSGIALILVGWLFFGYIYSLSSKQQDWPDLVKVYQALALGVLAINIYVLVYYGMRWYRLAGAAEAFVPLDYLFRDVRFFALVMFYCASIVLSKFLNRAYEEYTLLASKGKKAASK
jgi:Ca2+/Na+ antiporter